MTPPYTSSFLPPEANVSRRGRGLKAAAGLASAFGRLWRARDDGSNELLALAAKFEPAMPNLAAELRSIEIRHLERAA
jgi:hypothetical protein